jgi:hypothetical protein
MWCQTMTNDVGGGLPKNGGWRIDGSTSMAIAFGVQLLTIIYVGTSWKTHQDDDSDHIKDILKGQEAKVELLDHAREQDAYHLRDIDSSLKEIIEALQTMKETSGVQTNATSNRLDQLQKAVSDIQMFLRPPPLPGSPGAR